MSSIIERPKRRNKSGMGWKEGGVPENTEPGELRRNMRGLAEFGATGTGRKESKILNSLVLIYNQ